MNRITALIISCVMALGSPSLMGAQETAAKSAIRPAILLEYLPDKVLERVPTKRPVISTLVTRNGYPESACEEVYGRGETLVSISHIPDQSRLMHQIIRNYVASGNVENGSVTRQVSVRSYGTVIISRYHSANYSELIATLENRIILRMVHRSSAPAGALLSPVLEEELEHLSRLQP